MNEYTNIGCDFLDADRCRITSIQHVRNGKSIATITYVEDAKGLRIERLLAIDGFDKEKFKLEAKAIRECSTPQDFREEKLP